jgi:hypothetical protein
MELHEAVTRCSTRVIIPLTRPPATFVNET